MSACTRADTSTLNAAVGEWGLWQPGVSGAGRRAIAVGAVESLEHGHLEPYR